jgi:hypothetical protein
MMHPTIPKNGAECPVNSVTLQNLARKSRFKAEAFGAAFAEQKKALEAVSSHQWASQRLADVLEILLESPPTLLGELKKPVTRAAYFFSGASTGHGTVGFFKWDEPECRPRQLYHVSAFEQVPDCLGHDLKLVVLTPFGDGSASAEEYFVFLEERTEKETTIASNGKVDRLDLNHFEFIAAQQ